jgi:hypothetical protein
VGFNQALRSPRTILSVLKCRLPSKQLLNLLRAQTLQPDLSLPKLFINHTLPPSFVKAHPQYAYRPDLKEYLESISDVVCYKELDDGLYAVIRVHEGFPDWSKHIAGGPRRIEAAAAIRAHVSNTQ